MRTKIGLLSLCYYRSAEEGEGYEFAFGVPFSTPSYGPTAVSFNTFQPSNNYLDSENQVANWLSIVNLAQSSKTFTVNQYTQLGELISNCSVDVPPFGRRDVSAGHENGASLVGLNKISPADTSASYIAQLFRYGGNAPAGVTPTTYSFAFPLVAKAGNGETTYVPISNRYSGQDWVEVVNTSGSAVDVTVNFYDENGNVLDTDELELEAYGQRHLDASVLLGEDGFGFASLSPSTANSIITQNMFYFYVTSGSISAMYGSQAQEALGTTLHGSYNLFLDMQSPWKLHNTSASSLSLTVDVGTLDGTSTELTYDIDSHGTLELDLEDGATFGTQADTYGVISVSGSEAGACFAEILRVRQNSSGEFDFIAPSPLCNSAGD